MSKEVHPAQVMEFLNSLFTLFDELTNQYEVYKVKRGRVSGGYLGLGGCKGLRL